jgi:ligand-binding sensor domain-containing protein
VSRFQIFVFLVVQIFIPLAASPQSPAPTYRFVNFGPKDGLQEKVVYNLVQDKKGFLWLGTATGLYRYDGNRFLYIRSPLDTPGRSIANILQAIYCDSGGNLWLGSLTDLQWYNPRRNRFWRPDVRKQKEVAAITQSYFYHISESADYIWLSSAKKRVFRFSKKDSVFTPFYNNFPAGASNTSLFTQQWKQQVYTVHPEGIYVFDTTGKLIRFVEKKPANITNAVFRSGDTSLYLLTDGSGVLQFHLNNLQWTSPFSPTKQLQQLRLFSMGTAINGSVFLGGDVLSVHNATSGFFTLSQSSTTASDEFHPAVSKVVNIVSDRENNLWFCSHSGLSMLPWQNSQIKTLPLTDGTTGSITEPLGVYQHPQTGDYLIINSSGSGLQVIDAEMKQVKTIINPLRSKQFNGAINGLFATPAGDVYVSDGTHTFWINPKTFSLEPVRLTDQHGKNLYYPIRFTYSNTGLVYIGSYQNGFYIYNHKQRKLLHYLKKDVLPNDTAITDEGFLPCITDNENNIWFTSDDGVYRYAPQSNRWQHLRPGTTDSVPNMGPSRYIVQDKQGHFWITSNNNGIYELYFVNKKPFWKNYTVNSGIDLPSDFCNKVLQSPNDSLLWINNNAGLLRFDPFQKRVLSILTKQNGLYSHGFGYTFNIFPNNILIQLFYGAANIIDLGSYKFNNHAPVVALSSIKIFDKEILPLPDTKKQETTLNSSENFIEFEFSALQYNNSNQMQYACFLDNLDRQWKNLGTNTSVSYSGLSPGTYIFRVKACNNDGLWGNETQFQFTILPPLYRRWWFIVLLTLVMAGILYWWSKKRMEQAKREERIKTYYNQLIAETELKALRAQMNPHFIFNSLNSIQKYILKNQHEPASQYLTQFARLIRLILDHSDQKFVPLSSELEMLNLYLEMEKMRFENKFEAIFVIDSQLDPDFIEIPPMLIQPFVENAIWHGLLQLPDTEQCRPAILQIRYTCIDENNLQVEIEDNGIGRQQAAQKTYNTLSKKKSYGIELANNRIVALNQLYGTHAKSEIVDLYDAHGRPSGTLVKLTIPFRKLKNN